MPCLFDKMWFEWGLLFEPCDLWVGLYWKRYPAALEVYVCILPTVPLRLYWQWGF